MSGKSVCGLGEYKCFLPLQIFNVDSAGKSRKEINRVKKVNRRM